MKTKEEKIELAKTLFMSALLIVAMVALGIAGYLIPILLGLLALNLVVLIHETGHYLVARKCGVRIQVFSIGMGPRLVGFTKNGIDYRISLLPLGGYVRMEGESLFEEALKNNDSSILEQEGSLFATTPLRRIAIAVAGVTFNLISAVLFFFIAYLIGFSTPTDRALAPVSYFYEEEISPATLAGLLPGDIALKANGNKILSFQNLSEEIQDSEENLTLLVARGKEEITLNITLNIEGDKKRAGLVWLLSNKVSQVEEDSAFWQIGLREGDEILSINEIQTDYLSWHVLGEEAKKDEFNLIWKRNEALLSGTIDLTTDKENKLAGIGFAPIKFLEGREGFFPALKQGITKPAIWIGDNFKGLYDIATDPDKKLKDNAAGPIGITTGVGLMTLEGFKTSFFDGLGNFLMLTAVISSIIAIMNLLPIPALDGGMILFTLLEMIRRKRFSPKTFYYYQLFGFIVIMILGFAIISMDISNIDKYF